MRQAADALTAIFARFNIDTRLPGFYDSPQFRAEEARNPQFLSLYNDFVVTRTYDAEYRDGVRDRVTKLAQFMSRELHADGRLGACVDASAVAMRILESEGLWCCMFKGGLRIDFPPATNLRAQFFFPLMRPDNPAVAGHAWLVAPPFSIVDLTLSGQPFRSDEQRRLLPPVVLVENAERARPATLTELAEPELLELYVRHLGRRPTFADVVPPDVRRVLENH